MANLTNQSQTQYVRTGNPDTVNDASLYLGEVLGAVFTGSVGRYQTVQLDSGATASNTAGAVAPNELAFWMDKANYRVTNDLRFSQDGRNSVAGIFRNAATAGYYVNILQSGVGIAVKSSAGAANDAIIANSGTSADATAITAGTAPTYQILGYAKAANTGGNVSTDLNIPSAP